MRSVKQRLITFDKNIRCWMNQFGVLFLRISLGVVFLWFGFLKFFPELSPAEDLAKQSIEVLTFGFIPTDHGIKILAAWECCIGVGLLVGRWLRVVLFLLVLQMVGAMSPVFLFPQKVFVSVPWIPTLEGQYIIKNLVMISAAIVIGSTIDDPLGKKNSAEK